MLKGPEHCRDKHILELGSGTGLVGLAVGAFRNTNVWITDQASVYLLLPNAFSLTAIIWCLNSPLLGIMEQNVSLNNLQSCVKVAELNWLALWQSFANGDDLIC